MVTKSWCNKNKFFNGLNDHDVSDIDPCYKFFLEHLTKDGKSYVLEMANGDHGMPTFVRYEDTNSETVTNLSSTPLYRSPGHPTNRRPSVTSCTSPDENAGYSFLPRGCSVNRSSLVDESYEAFLSLLKFKDGVMVVEIEPGVSIVYEQERETYAASENLGNESVTNQQETVATPQNMETENVTSTDEEGLAQAENVTSGQEIDTALENFEMENITCADEQGLVPYSHPSDLTTCEDDQGSMLSLSCCAPSTFEDKLMAVLSQPYDEDEYEELMRKATDRKPVSRQRHLRSASKRYMTGAIGLSYLDHYPDLAIQIDSTDYHERLSLLRKFFFWLENLCHEGAYMPWIPKPIACDPIATDEYEPVLQLEMPKDDD